MRANRRAWSTVVVAVVAVTGALLQPTTAGASLRDLILSSINHNYFLIFVAVLVILLTRAMTAKVVRSERHCKRGGERQDRRNPNDHFDRVPHRRISPVRR